MVVNAIWGETDDEFDEMAEHPRGNTSKSSEMDDPRGSQSQNNHASGWAAWRNRGQDASHTDGENDRSSLVTRAIHKTKVATRWREVKIWPSEKNVGLDPQEIGNQRISIQLVPASCQN